MKLTFTPIKTLMLLVTLITLSNSNINANEDYWTLVCPPDVTVSCNAELWDLSTYGNAYISTYYGQQNAGTPSVHHYLNTCGSGYITRTWTAEDPYWNWISCTQTIWVGGGNSGYTSITWPADTTLFGCNPVTHPDVTGHPSFTYAECSMIGTSYKDMVFTVNEGCKKIMRTWTLMDWCSSGGSYHTWTHRQIIKLMTNEVPDFECPADITASATDCKSAFVDVPPIHIDPTSCGGNYTITNNSPYSISKGANLSGTYPVGKTKVGITISYGCGIVKACYVNVIVKNNKPPAPICLSHVTVALMGIDTNKDGINDEGMVDIWAKDLDWKSISPCGFHPLQFSFSPDSIDMFKRFTCDDLGINEINMYVFDSYGNNSYCKVKVDVQNNGAHITPCERLVVPIDTTSNDTTTIYHRLSLSGNVTYSNDKPVENLEFSLVDMENTIDYVSTFDTTIVLTKDSFINYSGAVLYFFEYDTTIVEHIDTIVLQNQDIITKTDDEGKFIYVDQLEKEKTYMLKCGKLSKDLVGIDKNDLDALTEYILGIRTLNTADEFIAADINSDGEINFDDLSLLIKYIKDEIQDFGDENWVVYFENDKIKEDPSSVLKSTLDWVQFEKITESIKDVRFKVAQKGDIVEKKAEISSKNNISFRTAEDLLNSYNATTVSAYPNPFNNVINISISSAQPGSAQIKLLDLSGKILTQSLKQVESGSSEIQLPVQDLPQSIILYQVILNGEVYSGKLFKIN